MSSSYIYWDVKIFEKCDLIIIILLVIIKSCIHFAFSNLFSFHSTELLLSN